MRRSHGASGVSQPRVTAEGVETSLVFERLRALGVDRVQGYLVSEPVPALELSSRCLRWSTARVTGMALY